MVATENCGEVYAISSGDEPNLPAFTLTERPATLSPAPSVASLKRARLYSGGALVVDDPADFLTSLIKLQRSEGRDWRRCRPDCHQRRRHHAAHGAALAGQDRRACRPERGNARRHRAGRPVPPVAAASRTHGEGAQSGEGCVTKKNYDRIREDIKATLRPVRAALSVKGIESSDIAAALICKALIEMHGLEYGEDILRTVTKQCIGYTRS